MIEEPALTNLFLVPTDFSDASLNACFFSFELAAKLNARIKLIHAYGMPEVRPMSFDDTDFYAGTISNHVNEFRAEADKNMAKLLEKIKKYQKNKSLPEVSVSHNIINGNPDEVILYTADTEKAGLIIMGISGKEVRTFEPMGKIASRVAEKTTQTPVLVVPEDLKFESIENVRNVLYITDFDESDFQAIGKLISIVKRLETNIFCLHIGNEEGDDWDKVKMEGLKEYFNKVYGKPNVKSDLIFSKDILKALDEFIISKNIDLISLTTHKRNIISKLINPSIALKILYHTRIPLLIFHK
jgi:nucleotide-binding universal stress UspA family protein